MLTIERILWTSAGSASPPAATMRRRMAETSSHSWRKYLRRTTSLESCSSSPTAAGSAEASPLGASPAGSGGAGVAALGTGAAAAAVSSIAGARGWLPDLVVPWWCARLPDLWPHVTLTVNYGVKQIQFTNLISELRVSDAKESNEVFDPAIKE